MDPGRHHRSAWIHAGIQQRGDLSKRARRDDGLLADGLSYNRQEPAGLPGLRPVGRLNLLQTSDPVARKPNYGFEKRMKELGRKQKQDAKLARKAEEAKARADEKARADGEVPPEQQE
jgi:hypothetical protein